MFHIPIQALSYNQAHKGKRYKSPDYRQYQQIIHAHLLALKPQLPKIKPKQDYYLHFVFGIPYRQDASNGIKIFEDILSDCLGVNDRDVKALFCRKVVTKKEDCFIKFDVFTEEYDLLRSINDEEL